MLKPVEKPIKFIKNLLTKGKSYPITHVSAVIDDNGESVKSTIDSLKNKGSLTKVTWLELKNKRDAGKLIPGSLYRITDYNCTTTQRNTQSAGHQFDIVLLALSENKLAEEGWAMMHIDNIYKVVFDDNEVVSCYVTPIPHRQNMYYVVNVDTLLGSDITITSDRIDEDNKIITLIEGWTPDVLVDPDLPYNYFQNSNLSAWKVWYCLDNDTDRFAWADDSVDEGSPATIEIIPSGGGLGDIETYTRDESLDVVKSDTQYYGWTAQGIIPNNIYTTTETPAQEDNLFTLNRKGTMSSYSGDIVSFTPAHEGTGLPNGRGVIYRLIDEFNNDVPYDFKNIQTKLNEENDYEYTFYFGPMGTVVGVDPHTDMSIPTSLEGLTFMSINNKIGYFINDTIVDEYNLGQFLIPFVHLEGPALSNTIGSYASQVKLIQCSYNTIGDFATYMSLDTVKYSSFGHNCGQDGEIAISNKENLNYGNGGIELATKS